MALPARMPGISGRMLAVDDNFRRMTMKRRISDMKTNKLIWLAIALMTIILAAGLVDIAAAQEVKFCKDAETGEIIVVEINMPCPFPTHEI